MHNSLCLNSALSRAWYRTQWSHAAGSTSYVCISALDCNLVTSDRKRDWLSYVCRDPSPGIYLPSTTHIRSWSTSGHPPQIILPYPVLISLQTQFLSGRDPPPAEIPHRPRSIPRRDSSMAPIDFGPRFFFGCDSIGSCHSFPLCMNVLLGHIPRLLL